MKKLFVLMLVFCVCFALPLLAQEEKQSEEMSQMTPPKPLDDPWCNWLIGQWEGTSTSEMGSSESWEKFEMGLDGQFLFRSAESTEPNGMTYKGMGAITVNPQSGKHVGYWIDSWRGMYEGSGTAEGDELSMTWEGYQGTYTQTIKKAGEDKMTGTWQFTDPEGNVMEGTFEMMRKKDMTDKSN